MKKFLLLLSACILISPVHSQDVKNIVLSSQEAVKVSSFEALTTLTITDNQGNERIRQNTMASKSYADQTEKRIIKFTAPAEVKGTGILIFDYPEKNDDMWIYLPALKKTRRIVSSEKSKSFMGSEFTNADMTAPGIEDFTYTLLGSEEVEGEECWKISAVPITMNLEDEYGYSMAIRWIIKANFVVKKTEYFNFDEELMKTIETINYKLLEESAGKYMITEMIARNLINGRSSRMKMDKIQITASDDKYFSVAYLER